MFVWVKPVVILPERWQLLTLCLRRLYRVYWQLITHIAVFIVWTFHVLSQTKSLSHLTSVLIRELTWKTFALHDHTRNLLVFNYLVEWAAMRGPQNAAFRKTHAVENYTCHFSYCVCLDFSKHSWKSVCFWNQPRNGINKEYLAHLLWCIWCGRFL